MKEPVGQVQYSGVQYQVINEDMDNPAKELLLLEQYNHKLEDENSAKTQQIKVLRQQLQTKSASRIVSSYTTNVSTCTNCKNKQLQIDQLKKSLKELKEAHETDIKRLGTPKERVVYKEIQSPAKRDELDKWKKAYDQLKIKYEESQKIEWSRLKVDGNQPSKQETQALKQQNSQLSNKVEFLQKRLVGIEDANQMLREEIQFHRKCSPKPTSVQYSQLSKQPASHQIPTEMMQPSAPTFRYLPPPSVKNVSFQVPPAPDFHFPQKQASYECCLSPLAVFEQRSHVGQGVDYPGENYYKNIVEERWRSLQHKIRVLEEENGRLRTEVVLPLQYY